MSADPLGIDPAMAPCLLHHSHTPIAWINEQHHVILESWTDALGLPQSRKVSLCPTGHVNVHAALRDRIALRPSTHPVSSAMHALVEEAYAFYLAHTAELVTRGLIDW